MLAPPVPPPSFDDMAPGCPYLTGGQVATTGVHTVYAASCDFYYTADGPVSRTFRILTPPDTTITSGPTGAIWDPSPEFSFTSTIPGSTFECRLDGGAFSRAATPLRTPTLAPGDHTFAVRAIAPGGIADPTPALAAFSLNGPVAMQDSCTVQPVYWAHGPSTSATPTSTPARAASAIAVP